MPNGVNAIKASLEFIAGAIGSGGKARKELLASASEMVAAMQMASAVSTARLAAALAATTIAEKRQILASLTAGEVAQMGRVNGLCGPIAAAANQLSHALSTEWANVNIGSHGLARHAFQTLQDGEGGLQRLFSETIAAQVPDVELDDWIRKKLGELLEIGTTATDVVRAITRAI